MVGKDGQTKFAIENTTRTRIVIADKRVHILGTFADINVARNALVSLILGSPPNKIYAQLKNVAARMKDH
jgi:RNA-binding protein PNO1